ARGVKQMTTDELRALLDSDATSDYLFIDVRKPEKYREGHIPHFQNVPLKHVRKVASEMDQNKKIVVTCRTGAKGNEACKRLKRKGFTELYNLKGGMSMWHPMKRVK